MVDCVIDLVAANDQGWDETRRGVMGFLDQRAAPGHCLTDRPAAADLGCKLDAGPHPATTDLANAVPDQRVQPGMQVRAVFAGKLLHGAGPQQPNDQAADRASERVAAKSRATQRPDTSCASRDR